MSANSFIAPSTPLDRRQLGKYEVLCRLSTGGMSAIYLAHQTGLAGFKKLVVLKTILPDIGGEEDFVGMFLEEAKITAVFNHPNIAQVFELDTDDGQLFMAMEFVQGCTLVEMARACRQAREPIPVGFTLSAVRDTALALHYAHNFTDARGRKQIVIHRDVAEKNIMVTYEGVTKLLDFGIAKALGRSGHTSVGMVKGTSGYMSPEQIRGEPLDPRSDIFSAGVVMHECLTGLRLFHGKTAEEGMMAALREDVQPPSKWNPEVSRELDAVTLKALARDREKRFSTALEFARAIEKAAPGLLWHPEQSGEVVTRFFAERRAETRRLLESAAFGNETTGEVRVQSVLAKVRASAALPSSEPKAGDTPRRQSLVAAPKAVMPREEQEFTRPGVVPGANLALTAAKPTAARDDDEFTRPGVLPNDKAAKDGPALTAPKVSMPREDDALTRKASPGEVTGEQTPAVPGPAAQRGDSTSPARPKLLPRPSSPSGAARLAGGTAPEPALQRPAPSYDDDDDDREDKTIPAAALPDEIKNLRAQFAASAAARKQAAPQSATAPGAERGDLTTDPARPSGAQPPTPSAPRPPPPRTSTGETLSVTGKGEDPRRWEEDEEDDDGAKTAVALPNEVVKAIRSRSSPVPAPPPATAASAPEFPASPSLDDLETVRPRRTGLVVVLVLLALLALGGMLVLLDVIPLGGSTPAPDGPLPTPAPVKPGLPAPK